MASVTSMFSVTQPGDSDYPLKASDGSAGTMDEIRKRCSRAMPYEDPDFPAVDASIGGGDIGDSARGNTGTEGVSKVTEYVWLRPHDLCEKHNAGSPNFAVAQSGQCDVGGARCSALDVRQGGLGDCWYLAGVAAIAPNADLLNLVVPEDNYGGFEEETYCGAFHFRFFDFYSGKFADVVIDDRIPCNAANNISAFAHVLSDGPDGAKTNEFWPVLVEKAFAKYHGSYRGIKGGHVGDALEVLTAGFSGIWQLAEYKDPAKYDDLAAKVEPFLGVDCFLGIGTIHSLEQAEEQGAGEAYTKLGLRKKHDYSVLKHVHVREKGSGVERVLLQMRNPWGHTEWTGPLSDKDDDGWAELEEDLRPRNESGSTDIKEGAFWIDLRDVAKYCNKLYHCIFGMGQGTKFCSIRSSWPVELQEQKLTAVDKNFFHLYPAFTFEVRRELVDTVQIPDEEAGKCVCCLRLVLGELGVDLHPHPTFMYYLYEVRDEDESDLTTDLAGFYAKRKYVRYSGTKEGQMNELNVYLNPGRYAIVMALKTDNVKKFPVPYVGKPVPFSINLYTENETSLNQIN